MLSCELAAMESVEKSGHVKQGVRDGGRRVKAHLDTELPKPERKENKRKARRWRGIKSTSPLAQRTLLDR